MDRWLAAVEKDRPRHPAGAQDHRGPARRRPRPVHERRSATCCRACETCRAVIVQSYTTPRVVAGESLATDRNKCQLKPLRRTEYSRSSSPTRSGPSSGPAFPTGVCDWSKPGVDQQDTIPWMTYHDSVGGRPLGVAPASVAGADVDVLAAHVEAGNSGALPATGAGRGTLAASAAFAFALLLGFALRRVPHRR